MVMRRGISVLDLLDVPPGSQAVLPANIVSAFDRLTVIDHRSTVSASAYAAEGVASVSLVGQNALITQRSQVQILPPQPIKSMTYGRQRGGRFA